MGGNGSVCLHVCRSYWKIPTLYAFYVVLARTHIAELGSNMAEMRWTIKSMAGKGGMRMSSSVLPWQPSDKDRKWLRLKAFSADAILTHRVGFLDSPLPQNPSSSLKPCTLQPIPKLPFIIRTLTLPYALDLLLTCKISIHSEHQVFLTRTK